MGPGKGISLEAKIPINTEENNILNSISKIFKNNFLKEDNL